MNGVKERRKVESRGVRGTEVEEARKRRRTREGSRKRKGKGRRGRGRDGEGRRRARGHFWKKEEAVETREKEKRGYREGERPEKGQKGEETDSDFRQTLHKQQSTQRPKLPLGACIHVSPAAIRFLSE